MSISAARPTINPLFSQFLRFACVGAITYFVDAGVLRFMRNRAKRLGNFIGSEIRNRLR